MQTEMITTEQQLAPTLDQLLPPVLPAVYRMALGLTGERADAEDLVQEAALNACRSFGQFAAGTNFKAWFFKIVYNLFVSQYRRRRRAGTAIPIDGADRPDEIDLGGYGWHKPEVDALSRFLREGDSATILRAIEGLPDGYRAVATLYFVDDLSYQDIAAVVSAPIGTVRSRLHRGRALLKEALRELAAERGLTGSAAD
ncbi:MAG: RNA polymerase sigma factor [Gemmatimonadales bacterium]